MFARSLIRIAPVLPLIACGFEEMATGVGGTLPSGTSMGGTATTTTGPDAPTTTGTDATASGSGTMTTTTGEPETTTTTTTTGTSTGTSTGTTAGTMTTGTTDTGSSSSSTTEPPEPTCADGLLNQDESDVDCGGSCPTCLDGQVCGTADDCASGLCEAGLCAPAECQTDVDCAGLAGPCAAASCDQATKKCVLAPINEGGQCDDFNQCTQIDACAAGECVGGVPIDCTALDSFCGLGVCDPQSGTCVLTGKEGMEGMPCDDGFVCTPDDTCSAGLCGTGGPGYLLFENFAGDAPGWTLGPTWEVGPAMASPPAMNGADPATDHSPGDDHRLAGVLIGDLSKGQAVAKTCLTSPAVDTTALASAWVTFWRHLHTDYFPEVKNYVEVFDGIDWVEVELGYAFPGVDDPDWQEVVFDLTPYSNPALQVRICYDRGMFAVPFAGWSVDDVTIGPFVCTPE